MTVPVNNVSAPEPKAGKQLYDYQQKAIDDINFQLQMDMIPPFSQSIEYTNKKIINEITINLNIKKQNLSRKIKI